MSDRVEADLYYTLGAIRMNIVLIRRALIGLQIESCGEAVDELHAIIEQCTVMSEMANKSLAVRDDEATESPLVAEIH